ncbi:MAG: SpoIIE family protein phosphatase [Clostridia bacterium]|nr:SpoIIE family protein phosphatase [Clostridia bacterium]
MKKLREHAAVKSIGGIILLLVLFSIIVSMIGFSSFTDALMNQYSDGAFLTAETAADFVDADRIDAYVQSGGKSEEYLAAWNRLDQICNSSGATFVYVILPDRTDWAHITFLFSTIDHDSPYTVYDFGYVRETTNDEYRQKYRALYETGSMRQLVIRDKRYIETDPHITAMVPLKDSYGLTRAILCVQRQMDVMVKARTTYIRRIAAALIGLVLIVIAGQSMFLHRSLLRPLKLISEEATRFAGENTVAEKKLRDKIRSRDEVGQLASSIDRMEEQVRDYIENLKHITAEKERIGTELSLAARIQEAMLPGIFPPFPERSEFDLYAAMDPAKGIGGDFYDFFLIDDDHLCLVIADVSGKGIPAALFMMASKIILANNAMMGKSPAQILTDTNTSICSNNREEMFVTVWLGILEISSGKLTAANAGHEYPALKYADGHFELYRDKHGFVIGGMDGVKYKEYEILLKPGTKLFLYTDGVPEATDSSDEMFGTDRMAAALNDAADASPEHIIKNVRRSVDMFVRDAEQFDDMTMLCLEYKGKAADQSEMDIEAKVQNLPRVQDFVDKHLQSAGCPEKTRMQIGVSVEEIFVNIANYAYAPETGRATVRVETSDDPAKVSVTFIDWGVPYDPLEKKDPDVTLTAEERDVGGLGIFLTKKIMDDLSYEYREGKNILTMRKGW